MSKIDDSFIYPFTEIINSSDSLIGTSRKGGRNKTVQFPISLFFRTSDSLRVPELFASRVSSSGAPLPDMIRGQIFRFPTSLSGGFYLGGFNGFSINKNSLLICLEDSVGGSFSEVGSKYFVINESQPFSVLMVSELPPISSAQENVFYLLPFGELWIFDGEEFVLSGSVVRGRLIEDNVFVDEDGEPVDPFSGLLYYEVDLLQYYKWDGSKYVELSGSHSGANLSWLDLQDDYSIIPYPAMKQGDMLIARVRAYGTGALRPDGFGTLGGFKGVRVHHGAMVVCMEDSIGGSFSEVGYKYAIVGNRMSRNFLVEVPNHGSLPDFGEEGVIYLTMDTGNLYGFNLGDYYQIGAIIEGELVSSTLFREDGASQDEYIEPDGTHLYKDLDSGFYYTWDGIQYVPMNLDGGVGESTEDKVKLIQDYENISVTSEDTQKEFNEGIDLIIGELLPKPTYNAPTLTINLTSITIEVGSSNVRTISNAFTQRDAGAITGQRILKNGVVASNSGSYNETGTVPLGNTTYKGEVSYADGVVKPNPLTGNPDPRGRVLAGTIQSAERTITGILPYFWKDFDTAPNLNTLNLAAFNKVVAVSTGVVNIPMNLTNKFLVIIIPSTSTVKTKWEITPLNAGNVGSGNLVLSPIVKSLNSPNGYWTAQNFNVYATAYPTNINPKMELKN